MITKSKVISQVGGIENTKKITLEIEATPNAIETLCNMLSVIQWNCTVGHSAITAAFFDGDGSDKIKIKGLPDGSKGEAMAKALSSYGDDLMGLVSADNALAYNVTHVPIDGVESKVLRVTQVWPDLDEEKN
jgi:hypothetical protein